MSVIYLRGEIPDRSAAKVNLYESVSEMSNPMITLDQSDFTDAANYTQIREIKVSYALYALLDCVFVNCVL